MLGYTLLGRCSEVILPLISSATLQVEAEVTQTVHFPELTLVHTVTVKGTADFQFHRRAFFGDWAAGRFYFIRQICSPCRENFAFTRQGVLIPNDATLIGVHYTIEGGDTPYEEWNDLQFDLNLEHNCETGITRISVEAIGIGSVYFNPWFARRHVEFPGTELLGEYTFPISGSYRRELQETYYYPKNDPLYGMQCCILEYPDITQEGTITLTLA